MKRILILSLSLLPLGSILSAQQIREQSADLRISEKELREKAESNLYRQPGLTNPPLAGRETAPYDFCSDALLIPTLTAQICGTTVGATQDLPTGGHGCTPFGASDEGGPSIWYTFVGNGQVLDFYFPASGDAWDPEFNVYTNTCDTPVCVTGDDDSGGAEHDAHASFLSVQGQVYYLQVHDAGSSSSSFCFQFDAGQQPVVCSSSGSGAASNKFIKQVKMNHAAGATIINNTSNNNGGYGDFTASGVNVTAGQAYKFTLYPSLLPSGNPLFRWKVWIDFNNDADFDDAGENVASVSANGNVTTPNFTIPAGAVTNTPLRMRISMKTGAQFATACETGFNGEVEDYPIQIGAAASALISQGSTPGSAMLTLGYSAAEPAFSVFPNPTTGSFSIRYSALAGAASLQVLDLKGQVVHMQEIAATGDGILAYSGQQLAPGLYFARLIHAAGITDPGKIVVR